MRKLWIFALILGFNSLAYAGNVDNNSNYGAQYFRTANRNASTEIDAAANNPAGLVKLMDGFTIGFNYQGWLKEDKLAYGGTDYVANNPVPFLPNLSLAFKRDNWAGFLFFGFPGGGGSKDFKDGVPMFQTMVPLIASMGNAGNSAIDGAVLKKSSFKGTVAYYAVTLGGSFAINDMISVALAPRYIIAKKAYAANAVYGFTSTLAGGTEVGTSTMKLDAKQDAAGIGGIIGINLSPTKELNIGIRFETITKLTFKNSTTPDSDPTFASIGGFTDGKEAKRDLPPVTGLGVSYKVTPEFRAEVDFTYYHNRVANWGETDDPNKAGEKLSIAESFKNGWESGIALEYAVSPQLKASIGYLYSINGYQEGNLSSLAWGLDSHTFAGGATFTAMPNLDITLGALYINYISAKDKDQTTEFSQSKIGFGLGVDYRI